MLHEPAQRTGPDPAFLYKRRLGAWMFLLYALAGCAVWLLYRRIPEPAAPQERPVDHLEYPDSAHGSTLSPP